MPAAAGTKSNEAVTKPDEAGTKKPSNKERIQEIVKGIEDGIQNLFQSEKFADYLRTMSRFHNYSLNNTILIHLQKPNATLCAGFQQWKKKFERHVKRGERGITVIAPTPIKRRMEREKLDPDTQLPMQDRDGNTIKEIVEISIPLYKPVKVFDVSQTEGKPLPELASPLNGDVHQFDAFMEALRRTSPVPIGFDALPSKEDGYFSLDDQRIAIREGMSQVQTVSAAVHEIAHSVLHNQVVTEKMNPTLYTIAEICHTPALYHKERVPQKNVPKNLYRYEVRMGADRQFNAVGKHIREGFAGTVMTARPLPIPENGLLTLDSATDNAMLLSADRCTIGQFQRKFVKDRHTEEVEAESVSYAVCQYFGIETSSNSFGYIATWSKGKELSELKASLETIMSAANYLITSIDKHFKEICKERGINLDAQTAEAAKDSGAVQPETVAQNTVTEQAARPETAAENIPESGQSAPAETALTVDSQTTADTHTMAQSATAPSAPTASNGPVPPIQPEESETADPVPASTPEIVVTSEPDRKPEQSAEQEQETTGAADTLQNLRDEFWEGLHPLDQYPAPDEHIASDALVVAGYKGDDLLAVTRDRACELIAQDMTVYTVMTGENPEMAFDSEDIRQQPEKAFFAVPREEWEASPEFHAAIEARLERQAGREEAYIRYPGASFGVYRLREDTGITRAEMRDRLASGQLPKREQYNLIYTGPLYDLKNIHEVMKRLGENSPADFPGPAPSAGDIVVIKNDGSIYCNYVTEHIFTEISFSDFMGFDPEKQKEQTAEQNAANKSADKETAQTVKEATPPTAPEAAQTAPDGPTVAELEAQVRAGQSISLLDLANATHREEQSGGRRGNPTHAAKQRGPSMGGDGAVMAGPSVEAMDAAIRAGRSFTLRGLAAEEAGAGGAMRKESILSHLRRKATETETDVKRNKPAKSTERGL